MPLETATFIDDLVETNPVATDGLGQADDHLRLIKSAIKTTFPNVTGEVSATHTHLSNGYVPVGGIILWSGTVASIPTNWALCNGSNGTPDLRDRFVVGAGSTYTAGTSGGSLTTATGGSHDHGAVTGSDGAETTSSGGDHNHGEATGNHSLTISEIMTEFAPVGGASAIVAVTEADGSTHTALAHTHPIGTDGAHTHTVSDHTHSITSDAGHTHTATPPYYALAYIMRTT